MTMIKMNTEIMYQDMRATGEEIGLTTLSEQAILHSERHVCDAG